MTHDTILHIISTARSQVTKGPQHLHMAQTGFHINTIYLPLRPSLSTQTLSQAQQRSFQCLLAVQQHTLASQSRLSILLHGRQAPTSFSLMASSALLGSQALQQRSFQCLLAVQQHTLASQSRLSIFLHGRQVPTSFSLMASSALLGSQAMTVVHQSQSHSRHCHSAAHPQSRPHRLL